MGIFPLDGSDAIPEPFYSTLLVVLITGVVLIGVSAILKKVPSPKKSLKIVNGVLASVGVLVTIGGIVAGFILSFMYP